MKKYEAPVTEIVEIKAADVITTSVATDHQYDPNTGKQLD